MHYEGPFDCLIISSVTGILLTLVIITIVILAIVCGRKRQLRRRRGRALPSSGYSPMTQVLQPRPAQATHP